VTARKYSASMDEELLDAVRQAADDENVTVSAFLAEAARHRVRLLAMGRLLDEWEREHGSFTDEELEQAADDLWNAPSPGHWLDQASKTTRRSA
jgi:hypothetical protein